MEKLNITIDIPEYLINPEKITDKKNRELVFYFRRQLRRFHIKNEIISEMTDIIVPLPYEKKFEKIEEFVEKIQPKYKKYRSSYR
ncbi:hypothetical protein [Bacillus wiedmannii]|uniref:hypothetical protein n=1 Tax=Bacillus wiedmannii TaxID=1890302 RepID=UPI000BF0F077|nr:hypothetical protein [Bacillus wiedmannii]PEN61597.1 hypothetical protein CN576_21415 [Bacillus wiedmannii]PHA62843.1 hypothetical protein COE75_16520 [Bacillus wiedmannii]